MYITQGLKNAMQKAGNQTATIDGNHRRSWKEFGERVAKLAGALKKSGLSDGGRVAILSLNSDRYLEYYYAVPWIGAVVVPLNIRLAPPELIFLMNDSQSEILFVDETFEALLPAFEGKLETVKHTIHMGDHGAQEGKLDYEAILEATDPIPDALAGGDDLAGIFYTGGTTGLPKGVMLSHNNIVYNAFNMLTSTGYHSETIYLHAAPMFHAADYASTCGLTMVHGQHAIIPRYDPEDTLKILESEKVSNVTLVPTMINMLVNFPDIQQYDLSSVKMIFYGASPMPIEVLKKAMGILPQCGFAQGYGMTELSPLASFLEWKYHQFEGPLAKINSAGRAVPGVEVRVVDENGQEVPRGRVGEIVVQGDNVMLGYWNRPEETAKAIKAGWMHTQDIGYMDEDGFIYVTDRLKDMIISGGENVYSPEVENVVYQHPAVESCAVIGIPNDKWGESVHAIIVLHEGASTTEQEMIDFCKERLAGYKCPHSIEFRADPLPLSGAGKILKSELRKPFWAGKTKQVN